MPTTPSNEDGFQNRSSLISTGSLLKRRLSLLSVLPHYFIKRRLQVNRKYRARNGRRLGGVDEFEPVSCGSNMNHADEALGELVVSSSNGAVDFQSAKHPFD